MVEYLSFKQVGRMLSTSDRDVSEKAVRHWVSRGVKVGNQRVKLRCVHLPSGMAFTQELVDQFLAEINDMAATSAPAPTPAYSRSRRTGALRVRRCPDDDIGKYPATAGRT